MSTHQRIGEFLLRRLRDIGTTHVFGVPGDYNMSFLEQIEADPDLSWVGTCNELNAAYAADGHARGGRPGVLLTTYGVGCLSALNGVAGAYCEHIPLIHLSGSPPLHATRDGLRLHHSLLDGGYRNVHRAFAEFTAYTETITPHTAVEVIDHALLTALRTRRPVRLELPSDLSHVEIAVPTTSLETVFPDGSTASEEAAAVLSEALAGARTPLLVIDLPAVRRGLMPALDAFCAARGVPYTCTVPAAHTADPDASRYLGLLPGSERAQQAFRDADLLISCDLTETDVTTAGFTLDYRSRPHVRLSADAVASGTQVFYGTDTADVLAAVSGRTPAPAPPAPNTAPPAAPSPDEPLTQRSFFDALAGFLRPDDVLVAETGTSGQNTSGLRLPHGLRYVNQTSWGSIGYALPATLGAALAAPQRRHVLCVGDGSFQVTAQELSTILRLGLTPIIVLLDNGGYTIERAIMGVRSPYNDVAAWRYTELPRAFGADEDTVLLRSCRTGAELSAAFDAASHTAGASQRFTLIQVHLDPLDMTPATAGVGEMTRVFDYGVRAPANPLG
ncbi:alpha-keto acid decarboxylase family protein [Mycolicibacterium obuense]|uniref:alpha-keto acid decarboxylase family protein n=1 Tax=Mycolicibacterium obuense TaxID=1807 RepID=UPI00061CF619|nr:thiamine pyrophosphate-binding protein [Mycolicibacterium obuense]